MLVKGDQEPLAFTITKDESVVTPNSIIGVKIKINNKIYTYPENISYNSTTRKWVLPLTQSDIYSFGDIFEYSCQVNFGGNPQLIKTSPLQRKKIDDSLFKELWG